MGSTHRHPPPPAAGTAGGSALPSLGRAGSEQQRGSRARGCRAGQHGGLAGFGVHGESGAEGVLLPRHGVLTPQPLSGLRDPPLTPVPLCQGRRWQRPPCRGGSMAWGSGIPPGSWVARQGHRRAGLQAEATRCREGGSSAQAAPLCRPAARWGRARAAAEECGRQRAPHAHFPPRAHLAQSTSGARSCCSAGSPADASTRQRVGTYRSYSSPRCSQHAGTGTRGDGITDGAGERGQGNGTNRAGMHSGTSCSSTCARALARPGTGLAPRSHAAG